MRYSKDVEKVRIPTLTMEWETLMIGPTWTGLAAEMIANPASERTGLGEKRNKSAPGQASMEQMAGT